MTAILEDTPAELSALGRGIPPALSRDRAAVPGEGAGGALPLGARPGARRSRRCWRRRRGRRACRRWRSAARTRGSRASRRRTRRSSSGARQEVAALWERLRARPLSARDRAVGGGEDLVRARGRRARRGPRAGRRSCARRGAAPFRGLGQALAPDVRRGRSRPCSSSSDRRPRGRRSTSWGGGGRRHGEALLVVDQFEELFTLNRAGGAGALRGPARTARRRGGRPRPAVAAGRLPDQVRGPRAARDGLRVADAARRARAARRSAVRWSSRRRSAATASRTRRWSTRWWSRWRGARGALPLLAFAVVAPVGEAGPREEAAHAGGVRGDRRRGGRARAARRGDAGPRSAPTREPIVREIFRNLVTSHGTRAVAEREELLSVFPERKAGRGGAAELVDARLLTSYEVEGTEGSRAATGSRWCTSRC